MAGSSTSAASAFSERQSVYFLSELVVFREAALWVYRDSPMGFLSQLYGFLEAALWIS